MDVPVLPKLTSSSSSASISQFRRYANDYKTVPKHFQKDYSKEFCKIDKFKGKSFSFETKLNQLREQVDSSMKSTSLSMHQLIWKNAWEHYQTQQATCEIQIDELLTKVLSLESDPEFARQLITMKTNLAALQTEIDMKEDDFTKLYSSGKHAELILATEYKAQRTNSNESLFDESASFRITLDQVEKAATVKANCIEQLYNFDCAEEDRNVLEDFSDHFEWISAQYHSQRLFIVEKQNDSNSLNVSLASTHAQCTINYPKNWTASCSLNLKKIRDEYQRAETSKLLPAGSRMSAIVDRALLEMPGKTKHDIIEHYYWLKRVSYFCKEMNAVCFAEINTYEQLLQRAKTQLKLAAVQRHEEDKKLAELTARYEAAMEKAETLKQWRAAKLEQIQRDEKIAAMAQLEALGKQAAEIERQQQYRRQIKDAIKRQKQHIADQEQELQKQNAELELIALEQKRQRDAANASRIKFREEIRQQKLLEKKQLSEYQQLQRQVIEEQLEKLRCSVRPEVAKNWQRAISDNQSTTISKNTTKVATGQELFSVRFGYSKESILKNKLARLYEEFASVNLQSSNYAREILKRVGQERPLPPHLQSNIKDL